MLKKTRGEKIFDICNYIFLGTIIVITIFPFWSQLITSLSSSYEAYEKSVMFWPSKINIDAYKVMLNYKMVWTGFKNSFIRVIVGTSISIIVTAMLAYPLSKKKLPFNSFLTFLVLFTMLFNGGLIPNYLLIKELGMRDTRWALIIPGIVSAWNTLILRNFFKSIPECLEESATIDGAGYFRIFVQLIIPLSTPAIATIGLWVAVYYWNEWFSAMIYVNDPAKFVVQVVLRRFVLEDRTGEVDVIIRQMMDENSTKYSFRQLEAAVTMLVILPMLMVYPFIQKYFTKGIMIGSVKG